MTPPVIVLLAQEGKLSLDDPVSKYSRACPTQNITVTELLNMPSAFTATMTTRVLAILDRDPTKIWRPASAAIAFKHTPYFPPGTDFHYSNTNYALLGSLRKRSTGNRLRKSCTTLFGAG